MRNIRRFYGTLPQIVHKSSIFSIASKAYIFNWHLSANYHVCQLARHFIRLFHCTSHRCCHIMNQEGSARTRILLWAFPCAPPLSLWKRRIWHMECKLNTETVVIAVQDCPDNMPALGMTYSPWQQWTSVYEADVGFCRGTIFPELDKPFLEGACPCV